MPTHTRPAPACSAARPASSGAPTMPSAPPTMPSVPNVPLWTLRDRRRRTSGIAAESNSPLQAMARSVFEQSGIEVERMHGQRAAQIDAVAGQQPGLERDERCRRRRPNRRPENRSGVGVEPARHVERQDRRAGGIGPVDQGGIVGRRGAGESDAEQAIDDQCSLPLIRGRGRCRASRPDECAMRGSGVGGQPRRVPRKNHGHVEEPLPKPPRDDESVAAVVPGASQHENFAHAFACHRARDFRCREPGALHQRFATRRGLDRTQVGRSKNGCQGRGRMHGWKL